MSSDYSVTDVLDRSGAEISKSLQIFRARNSLISRCRGTVETFRVDVCT